jgi:CheY-like chemotaxis protein
MNETTKTVLLVDDDEDIRSIFSEVLTQEGYIVIEAENGRQALDLLEKNGVPNLVLLDLMMPIMDGFAFRDVQRKNPLWSNVPLIVMSADGAHQSEERQKRLGDVFFLKKPTDLDALLEAVHSQIH